LLPVSTHYDEEVPEPAPGVKVIASEIVSDSGTLMFLPLTEDLPKPLRKEVKQILSDEIGTSLKLPAGKWTVYYEQWDSKKRLPKENFRNITLKWQAE
jgi:hypothetical protein